MHKSLTLLSTALLLATASSTFAASSVDLAVKGLITPSACTPSLPAAGIVDYGKISAKDLNTDKPTVLERKTFQLMINCEASTLLAIKPVDNRAGTSIRNYGFGLGLINGDEKLGMYNLLFVDSAADVPSILLHSIDEGNVWRTLWDDDIVAPSYWVAFGSLGPAAYTPHPVQQATIDGQVLAVIAPANTLTLTNDVAMDGSATFEVLYL